jgi:hypothetical protein
MLDQHKRLSVAALVLLLGVGAGGMAMGASEDELMDGPVRCEIQATAKKSMIALKSVVMADVSTQGSYQFKVKSSGGSGRTNIQQGGNFSVEPDEEAILGKVTVGNNGATYDVTLKIMADGETIECSERFSHSA